MDPPLPTVDFPFFFRTNSGNPRAVPELLLLLLSIHVLIYDTIRDAILTGTCMRQIKLCQLLSTRRNSLPHRIATSRFFCRAHAAAQLGVINGVTFNGTSRDE